MNNSNIFIKCLKSTFLFIIYNKFKYVIVYVDEKKVYETKKKLMNAKGIKDIIDSQFELESFDLLQNTQVL